jgi:copper chaperone
LGRSIGKVDDAIVQDDILVHDIEVFIMYTFNVKGMGCGSCVNKIIQAIQNQDDEAKVVLDLPNRLFTVESAKSETTILTTIQKLGFNAALAT